MHPRALTLFFGALLAVLGACGHAPPPRKEGAPPRLSVVPPAHGRTLAYHTVEKGETLAAIAHRYGTTAGELRRLNPSLEPGRLGIGARIRVPQGKPSLRNVRVLPAAGGRPGPP